MYLKQAGLVESTGRGKFRKQSSLGSHHQCRSCVRNSTTFRSRPERGAMTRLLQHPKSHKVVFENAFVRFLEVTIPAPEWTEPMHHHRSPGFVLGWDTGGASEVPPFVVPV